MTTVIVDNDIVIKGAIYDLLWDMTSSIPGADRVSVLAVLKFITPKRLRKKLNDHEYDRAMRCFSKLLELSDLLEPTEQETKFAARLELAAQERGMSLDVGESQLLAILVRRSCDVLATGDKRAIHAMESLGSQFGFLEQTRSRIYCLEHLMRNLVVKGLCSKVRLTVCRHKEVDRTLAICFACHSPDVAESQVTEGLNSYIEDLRQFARVLLAL